MLITCSQHFSNYLMNKLLINMNFKIIERVYIVALLIFRVNAVSILSTPEQVYSHIYVYSLQRKWHYDFLKTYIPSISNFMHGML